MAKAQLLEVTGRVIEEKKSAQARRALYEEEKNRRELLELRIKELEEQLARSKEDSSLLFSRFQDDLRQERQYKMDLHETHLSELSTIQETIMALENKVKESERNVHDTSLQLLNTNELLAHEQLRAKALEGNYAKLMYIDR